jgi:hypothetical protein
MGAEGRDNERWMAAAGASGAEADETAKGGGEVTMTRELVLRAFQDLPPGVAITTMGLAWLAGCAEEYRVRAAVSWLMLGGLVEQAGEHWRRDRRGRAYRAKLYRWTGRADIRRVARDEDERRLLAARDPDATALAMAWLSRRWA